MSYAYVYILASSFKRLYVGVTTGLEKRVWEHKNDMHPDSFTSRYRIDRLVYFERFGDIQAAIAREKQLKGLLRSKKIALIVASNPAWKDLSLEWGRPVEPFYESGSDRQSERNAGVLRSAQDDDEEQEQAAGTAALVLL